MLKAVRTLLSGLNGLNWVIGALFIFFAIILTVVNPAAFLEVARARDVIQPEALLTWFATSAILMVPMMVAVHIILTRLIAMIDSIAAGQAFSVVNAERLRIIAWALLATQIIDLIGGLVAMHVSTETGEYLGWSFGVTGWLAALLLFILARIFREGAAMREELEGTV
jgi:hypothetical protein